MKKLLIGVAIVIVLLIAAAIAVPFFVPADTYKSQLIARVKDATGRDLRIDGKVSFSLLPSLALEADKVALSNAPGAGSKDMATFDQLEVQLKLWPLLQRRVEVDRLVLVNPVIALEVDKQGRPNWQFSQAAPGPAKPGAAAPAPSAASGGGSGLAELRLDDVRLVNGKISYLDQRSGAKQELDQIAMKLSLPGLDQPFAADGAAVYRGEKLTLTLSLANPRAFLGGKTSAAALKLASKPVNFDFKGEAAGSTPLKLDGAVDLQVPSVRGLAQWAGNPLKAPGNGFGPLKIAGKVSLAGAKMAFTGATLSLDQINATGELALDTGGARPALKGQLAVDKLDVNPYLPPEGAGGAAAPAPGGGGAAGGGTPPAKSSGWSDEPIDLTALKAADAEFNLSANSLLYRKIQVGKSALALHLRDGRFEADLTELQLYQGAGKGKVTLDGSGAVPAIAASFDLSQVQIGPLLKDAIDLNKLGGVGAFDMAVSGHGRSQREIVSALDGKGSLNLANGTIKGVNLVAMVRNAASAFDIGSRSTQQTDFASLSGTYTITNGILRNNDLQLKAAELPMTGAGTVDLPRRSVDYKLTPRVAGALAVPVIIRGPWDDLTYAPDLTGIANDASKLLQGGGKGVGDALKSAPGGVGGVLKGILGGQKK
jgi:AsmA protein